MTTTELREAYAEALDLADGEAIDACGLLLEAVGKYLSDGDRDRGDILVSRRGDGTRFYMRRDLDRTVANVWQDKASKEWTVRLLDGPNGSRYERRSTEDQADAVALAYAASVTA